MLLLDRATNNATRAMTVAGAGTRICGLLKSGSREVSAVAASGSMRLASLLACLAAFPPHFAWEAVGRALSQRSEARSGAGHRPPRPRTDDGVAGRRVGRRRRRARRRRPGDLPAR